MYTASSRVSSVHQFFGENLPPGVKKIHLLLLVVSPIQIGSFLVPPIQIGSSWVSPLFTNRFVTQELTKTTKLNYVAVHLYNKRQSFI